MPDHTLADIRPHLLAFGLTDPEIDADSPALEQAIHQLNHLRDEASDG